MQTKTKIITILSILTLSSMVSQPTIELWTQKITIENRLRDKFTLAIGRLIPETEFIVNVEAELTEETVKQKRIDGTDLERFSGLEPGSGQDTEKSTNSKGNNLNNNDGYCFDCAGCILDFNYMGPIPCEGRHLEPPCASAIQIECQENKTQSTGQKPTKIYNFTQTNEEKSKENISTSSFLNNLDVTIYLAESSMQPATVSEVFEIVCDLMPDAKKCNDDCSDCIQIKQYEFSNTKKGKSGEKTELLLQRIKDLENAAEEQQRQIRDEREKASKRRLQKLEEELYTLQTERSTARDEDLKKNDQRLRELELKEEEARRQADLDLRDLKKREEDRITVAMKRYDDMLERVLLGAQTQTKTVDQAITRDTEYKQRRHPKEKMQYPNSKNESLMWVVLLVVVIIGFCVLYVLLKPSPKPVYLRPKKKNEKGTQENEPSDEKEKQATPTMIKEHEQKQKEQSINENKEVINSEVKSLRQSAVTMSVGQKEAATKIIEEWLDDGAAETKEENQENNEEKTEE